MGRDVVGGHIRVEVAPGSDSFTVTYNGTQTDSYALWEAGQPEPEALPAFAWSRRSRVYHRVGCRYVNSILPENPERGDEPPAGKTLHQGCPVL